MHTGSCCGGAAASQTCSQIDGVCARVRLRLRGGWRARLALALASCDRVTRLVRAERNRMRLENKFDEIRRLERQKAHRRQLAEQASAEKSLRIEEHLVQVRDTHRALLGRSGCGPLGTATQ
jgi:hypothetical protein